LSGKVNKTVSKSRFPRLNGIDSAYEPFYERVRAFPLDGELDYAHGEQDYRQKLQVFVLHPNQVSQSCGGGDYGPDYQKLDFVVAEQRTGLLIERRRLTAVGNVLSGLAVIEKAFLLFAYAHYARPVVDHLFQPFYI
jgi:hypothetical protein